MSRIGLVLHDAADHAVDYARALAEDLHGSGHVVVSAGGSRGIEHLLAVDEDSFADGLDLAVSLGGDGTMLRTMHLLDGADIDILGANFGDLGYLTVTEPHELAGDVARALSGDCSIEHRMLVEGVLGDQHAHALNDLVVERAPGETSIRIGVAIDGVPFTTYPADGLILATPTGSTAYALSARGPIVAPTHECLQLTPVSPHMLFDRTLILNPESTLDLTIEGHRPAAVSVDGRTMWSMQPGATLHCRRSTRTARLVTFGDRDHLGVLKSKLGLTDR